MSLSAAVRVPSARAYLESLRKQEGYTEMDTPESSSLTEAVSNVFNRIKNISLPTSITSVVKPLSKLGVSAALSAAVSGVVSTLTDAGLDSIIERKLSPLETILDLGVYTANSVSGLWGFLIFGLGVSLLRSAIHDEDANIIPPDYTSAVKESLNCGSYSGLCLSAFRKIVKTYASPTISGVISSALGLWGGYKIIRSLF